MAWVQFVLSLYRQQTTVWISDGLTLVYWRISLGHLQMDSPWAKCKPIPVQTFWARPQDTLNMLLVTSRLTACSASFPVVLFEGKVTLVYILKHEILFKWNSASWVIASIDTPVFKLQNLKNRRRDYGTCI